MPERADGADSTRCGVELTAERAFDILVTLDVAGQGDDYCVPVHTVGSGWAGYTTGELRAALHCVIARERERETARETFQRNREAIDRGGACPMCGQTGRSDAG